MATQILETGRTQESREGGCMSYFPVAMMKCQWPRAAYRGRRFILAYIPERQPTMVREASQPAVATGSQEITSSTANTKQRERLEAWWSCTLTEPAPSDFLQLAAPPPQTAPSTGNQVFKFLSLWETIAHSNHLGRSLNDGHLHWRIESYGRQSSAGRLKKLIEFQLG